MTLRRPRIASILYSLIAMASGLGLNACDEEPSPKTGESAIAVRITEGEQCESIPAPRWVLRDRDGNRIHALVEPRCGDGSYAESWNRCNPVDPASKRNFPCVRIIDHQGSFINLQYDLESGQLGPCQSYTLHKDLADLGVQYLNDRCEGTQYISSGSSGGYPEFTTTRSIYFVGDDIWYVSQPGCVEDAQIWGGDTCSGPFQGWGQCPIRPIPDWVKNLLPNPPYTMAVEYE